AMEYPHIRARAIDVTLDEALPWLARTLAADLCAPWVEPVVAYRGRYRWAQSFEPIDLPAPDGLPLREAGVYLITGGLGGIGLEIARYLARTLRARLALVGRTGLPPRERWAGWLAGHDQADGMSRRIRCVQEMEAAGA